MVEPRAEGCGRLRGMRPDADDPGRDRHALRRFEQDAHALLEIRRPAARHPDRVEAERLELGGGVGDLGRIARAQLGAPDADLPGLCHRADRTPSGALAILGWCLLMRQLSRTDMSQIAELPLDDLKDELAAQAAHMSAGMCRYLELVGECDRRGTGWDSTAEFLAWRCGLTPRSAREHVRVARALGGLPLIREAFATGELSYSKVRALTRVRRPQHGGRAARLCEGADRFAARSSAARLSARHDGRGGGGPGARRR